MKPARWINPLTRTRSRWKMLTVLGGLTEFERDLIRARTSEGRERAKARGVKLGRKPKPTPPQRRGADPLVRACRVRSISVA
jgi:DNA invertase Pin-like site-specific DNA recombinase